MPIILGLDSINPICKQLWNSVDHQFIHDAQGLLVSCIEWDFMPKGQCHIPAPGNADWRTTCHLSLHGHSLISVHSSRTATTDYPAVILSLFETKQNKTERPTKKKQNKSNKTKTKQEKAHTYKYVQNCRDTLYIDIPTVIWQLSCAFCFATVYRLLSVMNDRLINDRGTGENRPNSQFPWCISPKPHNASVLFWMLHCGRWNRCIVECVRLVFCGLYLLFRGDDVFKVLLSLVSDCVIWLASLRLLKNWTFGNTLVYKTTIYYFTTRPSHCRLMATYVLMMCNCYGYVKQHQIR